MDRVRRLCINGLLPVLLAGVCGCGGAASPTTTTTTTTTPAAALSTLTLSPTSINGGQTAMVTVTLTEPAPTGGIVVNISTSNTTVMIELKNAVGTIKIPAGATSVTAKITSLPVGSLQLAQ